MDILAINVEEDTKLMLRIIGAEIIGERMNEVETESEDSITGEISMEINNMYQV